MKKALIDLRLILLFATFISLKRYTFAFSSDNKFFNEEVYAYFEEKDGVTYNMSPPDVNNLPKIIPNVTQEANGTKIYNGSFANMRYGFMVAILSENGGLICGGVLINYLHVLTAAHCFNKDGKFPSTAQFWVGAYDLSNPNEEGVYKTGWANFRKGKYDPQKRYEDYVIFRLKQKVTRVNYYPYSICISKQNFVEQKVSLIGFGTTSNGQTTSKLQFAKGTTLPNNQCKTLDTPFDGTRQLCAKIYNDNGGRAEQLNGDSGGPLFFQNTNTMKFVLAGIVSYNVNNNQDIPNYEFTGIYTRTSVFTNYIREYAGEIDTNC